MGMFDDVLCERELPDGFEGRNFQTKDFGCDLDKYTITADGRLKRRYVSEHVPTDESEWRYSPDDPDPLHRIWHENSKWRPVYSECDMSFHGILNFYTCTGDRKDGTWEWFEYNAKFTDGQLVSIERDMRRRD
jgi:hypothetical protein